MRTWPLLVVLAVAACGGDPQCPLIGCVSQLSVELPAGAASGRACVQDVCATEPVDGVLQVPLSRRTEGATVPVVVEVVDAAGLTSTYRGDAAVVTDRPNGEGCPPICLTGSVRLRPGGAVVDVPPGS